MFASKAPPNVQKPATITSNAKEEVLSDEVWILVFSYLSVKHLYIASRVNRRWNRVSQDSVLWQELAEKETGKKVTKCENKAEITKRAMELLKRYGGFRHILEDYKKRSLHALKPGCGGNDFKRKVCVKIVIVGSPKVGKTNMLLKYLNGQFEKEYVSTVFDNHSTYGLLEHIFFNIVLWDTSGKKDYDGLRPLTYPGTDALVLCFSMVDRQSFEEIKSKWSDEIYHFLPNCPILLVGNKYDLLDDEDTLADLKSKGINPVGIDEGFTLAAQIRAKEFILCSAKSGENVNLVFSEAVVATSPELTHTLKKEGSKGKEKGRCNVQ